MQKQIQSCQDAEQSKNMFCQIRHASQQTRFTVNSIYNQYQLYPVCNNTFLLRKPQGIFHIDAEGNELKSMKMNQKYGEYVRIHMMTQQHAIMQVFIKDTWTYSIVQWNLQTNQTINLPCANSYYTQLLCFLQTMLIGIVQKSPESHFRTNCYSSMDKLNYRISFYKYPLKSQSDEPVHRFFSMKENNSFHFYHKFKKINDKCAVGFYCPHSFMNDVNIYEGGKIDDLQIQVYDFMRNPYKFVVYKINDDFIEDKSLNSPTIMDIWQYDDYLLFVQVRTQLCLTKFGHKKAIQGLQFKQQQIQKLANDIKIYDLILDKRHADIKVNEKGDININAKMAQFSKNISKNEFHSIQFINQIRQVQCNYFPTINTKINQISHKNGLTRAEPKQMPIYYIKNIEQQPEMVEINKKYSIAYSSPYVDKYKSRQRILQPDHKPNYRCIIQQKTRKSANTITNPNPNPNANINPNTHINSETILNLNPYNFNYPNYYVYVQKQFIVNCQIQIYKFVAKYSPQIIFADMLLKVCNDLHEDLLAASLQLIIGPHLREYCHCERYPLCFQQE